MVSKLWSGFARPVGANDPVVRQLTPAFAKDQDVGRLMRAIFLHPEFVAPASRTGLVKTPIEYVAGALRALRLRAAVLGNNLPQTMESLGQRPFAPPSVGGWPPNGYWLTTSFALSRLRIASMLAGKAKLDTIAEVPAADRPAATARLLSVDGWGPATSAGRAPCPTRRCSPAGSAGGST